MAHGVGHTGMDCRLGEGPCGSACRGNRSLKNDRDANRPCCLEKFSEGVALFLFLRGLHQGDRLLPEAECLLLVPSVNRCQDAALCGEKALSQTVVDADPGGENLLLPRQNRNRVSILQKPFVNLFQVLLLPFKLLHQGVRFRHIRRRDLVHISQFRGQDPAVQTPDGAILKGQKTAFSSRLPERVGIEQGLSGGG